MEDWKPSYGGKKEFKKKNEFYLKDGDSVYRILPQPKGNDDVRSQQWSKYYAIHFGYKNMAGKVRSFESCQVKKDKVVSVNDPALDRLNQYKAAMEKAKTEGNEAMYQKLWALVGFKGVYNLDSNHYMNVMTLDGTIGVLKIRYSAKLALDEEIKKLQAMGIEPLSFDNGRFFVFSRTGSNRDTAFKVSVYKEKIQTSEYGTVEKDLISKVTPEILAKLEIDGWNLNTEIAYKITPEEIKQIVDESELMTGKSPACDRIFDARWKAEREAKKGQSGSAQGSVVVNTPVQNTFVATAAQTVFQTPTQTLPVPQIVTHAPSIQTLAVPQTTTVAPQATTVVEPQATTIVKTTSTPVDEMSDEDFFKQIGN